MPGALLSGAAADDPCPSCGGRFTFLNGNDRGSFECEDATDGRTIKGGDGFLLMGHLFGFTYEQAVRLAGLVVGSKEPAPPEAVALLSTPNPPGN